MVETAFSLQCTLAHLEGFAQCFQYIPEEYDMVFNLLPPFYS